MNARNTTVVVAPFPGRHGPRRDSTFVGARARAMEASGGGDAGSDASRVARDHAEILPARGAFTRYRRRPGVAGDDERYAAFLDALRARFAEDGFVFVVPDERARDDERHEDLVAAVLGEYDRTLRIAVERDDARALRYDPQETMARKYPGFHEVRPSPRDTSFPNPRPAAREPAPVVVVGGRRGGSSTSGHPPNLRRRARVMIRRPSHLRRPLSPPPPPDDRVGGRVDMDATEATRRGRFPFARGDLGPPPDARRTATRLATPEPRLEGRARASTTRPRRRFRGADPGAPREVGCVVSLEGDDHQNWHQDGDTGRDPNARDSASWLARTSPSPRRKTARLK